jgi:hypothetical protein
MTSEANAEPSECNERHNYNKMVHLEFFPIPDHPDGVTFDTDEEDEFKLRDMRYACLKKSEILAPSIVHQLVEEYHGYPIGEYVYSKQGDRLIVRQVDRRPWLPLIYEKAKERIQETFANTELTPVRLIQTMESIKYKEIRVDGCPQYFYIRPHVNSEAVYFTVMFYNSAVDRQTVLKVCQIKDD